MGNTINLGPLALDAAIFSFIVAYILSFVSLSVLSRKFSIDQRWMRSTFDGAFFSALIGARLGFVFSYWPAFQQEPWTMFYFWQSGYMLGAGVVTWLAFMVAKVAVMTSDQRKQNMGTLSLHLSLFLSIYLLSSTIITGNVGDQASNSEYPLLTNFQMQTLEGDAVSLESLKGQPSIINFWATWCGPCRREMQLLNDAYHEYQDQGINLVAINMSEPVNLVESYLKENNLDLPVWVDGVDLGEDVFHNLGGEVLPTTLFIDAQGDIRRIRVGELSSGTLLQGVIDIH